LDGLDKGVVMIAVVFDVPGGKTAVWKGDSDLDNMFVPKGASKVSGFHFVWASKFEYAFKDSNTFLKMLGEEGIEISGPNGSIRLREAKYRLTFPVTKRGWVLAIDLLKPMLMVDLPYG